MENPRKTLERQRSGVSHICRIPGFRD